MSLCWFFSREDLELKTPSREDGIPLLLETRYRKEGARFLINASKTLDLHFNTHATGVVFFHRFFMLQSFKQFNRWVVAAACLLLAGKVEETPKKCKDVLKVTRSLLTDQQMAAFGSNPKEELLTHERILLQTIKFDLQVSHPYGFILKFAKDLKGEKSKINNLVQMAWTFVNDSLCTTLCLQWEPRAIAVAFIYLAGKLSKQEVATLAPLARGRSWWRAFVDTLDVHDLEAICHQVLDFYGEKQKAAEESQDQQATPTSSKHPPIPTSTLTTSHSSLPPGHTPSHPSLPPGGPSHPLAVSTSSHPHTLPPSQPPVPAPPSQPVTPVHPHPTAAIALPTNQIVLQAISMAGLPSPYAALHPPVVTTRTLPLSLLPPSLPPLPPTQPAAYASLGIPMPHPQVPRPQVPHPQVPHPPTSLGSTSLTGTILQPTHPHTPTITPSQYPLSYQSPHTLTPTPLLPAQNLLGAPPTKRLALDPAYQPLPQPYAALPPAFPPSSTPSQLPMLPHPQAFSPSASLQGVWQQRHS